MKVIAVTQARIGSSRLPGKVLKEINGTSLLKIHLDRILQATSIDQLIVATTQEEGVEQIIKICNQAGVSYFQGSLHNVLDRFYQAVKGLHPDYVVRLTSDCPLIDHRLIDIIVEQAIRKGVDYYSNTLDPGFPDGQDIEVIKFDALEKAWNEATLLSDQEHVTPYIWRNSSYKGGDTFTADNHVVEGQNYGHLRMTVDEPRDFELIKILINRLGMNATWQEYADLMEENSSIQSINAAIHRNEGYTQSVSKENNMKTKGPTHRYSQSEILLARALKTIPLGSQTFSKSKTQYPYGVSPYFISRARGANVWDVDGNKYIDFINSLCSITLGYNDPDVTRAVQNQLKIGTIFSLPHELEFLVAEKICELVPCAEKVRFGKNGSDVTSGAIRVARAYTGRDHVLVCGYHGWQDWYIASTTRDKGIPQAVKDLTHKFNYNDLHSLETKLNAMPGQVAAVILEPVNVTPPQPGFLQGVKDLAHRHGALFIMDETITGFRYSIGGAQEYFGVTPDLATFGKGVANGYPLSVLAGKSEYMREVEDIFFSFTFGGELLSLAASYAVLNKLQREPVIQHLFNIGQQVMDELSALIDRRKWSHIFSVGGYPVWSFFNIKDTPPFTSFALKTLLMQVMFEQGILMYGTHNISYSHTPAHVKKLIKAYSNYFDQVKKAFAQGSLDGILKCEPLEPLFKVR